MLGSDLAAEVEKQQRRRAEVERFAWPVADWSHAVGISRASVFNLLKAGKIESVLFGGKRLVTTHPKAFIAGLASQKMEAA
jgi:hypothetical protein